MLDAWLPKRLRIRLLAVLMPIALSVAAGPNPAASADNDGVEQAYAPADRPTPVIEIQGRACVVDGDTLVLEAVRERGRCIGGRTVHLADIDAPELAQKCRDVFLITNACGRYALSALSHVTWKRPIRCVVRPAKTSGEFLGECLVAGKSLNAFMVRQGWALAFTDGGELRRLERIARRDRRGIWKTEFLAPWLWRKARG